MNKTMKANINEEAGKISMCLMGKIQEDINNRLPVKPKELDKWEKYKLIKAGKAAIKKGYKASEICSRYNDIPLTEAFTYPKSQELLDYERAVKKISGEKATRELALENAIRRVKSEALLEVITLGDFLTKLEKIASQEW